MIPDNLAWCHVHTFHVYVLIWYVAFQVGSKYPFISYQYIPRILKTWTFLLRRGIQRIEEDMW